MSDLEHLAAAAHHAPDGERILHAVTKVGRMLISKNIAYGGSALNPVRIFSQASPQEQLLVRIDDKLSRLASGMDDDEDAVMDLAGYLILLIAARKDND